MTLVTRGFHHITLVARDSARTVAFYRDLLGLALLHRTRNVDDAASEHLFFTTADGAPGTLVTVLHWSDLQHGRWGVGGIHHVAWRVADESTQLAVRQRVAEAHRRPTAVIDRFWFKSVYFMEPGGALFELATDGPGFTVDESLATLGDALVLPPWLEPMRAEIESNLPKLTNPVGSA